MGAKYNRAFLFFTAVHTEFTSIRTLFGQYQQDLEKAYPKPEVKSPQ